MDSKPPDGQPPAKPDLTYEQALHNLEQAKLDKAAALSRIDKARTALARFLPDEEPRVLTPRPKGMVVARPQWRKIAPLPLYHPLNVFQAVMLLVLAFLVLSGAGFWLWDLFA